MGVLIAHPWACAAVAVSVGFAIPAVVLYLDACAVRRRRARRGGYLIGGQR